MRFWDTSADVALLVAEPRSASARTLLESDPAIIVWWGTRTECVSALSRQLRDGDLTVPGHRQARRVLAALVPAWAEILPGEAVRVAAERCSPSTFEGSRRLSAVVRPQLVPRTT